MQIRTLAPLALSLATIFPGLFVNAASVSHTGLQSSSARAAAGSKYTKAHSLGDSYKFDPRDGWRTLNASDAQYKYRRDKAPALKANDKSKAVGPLKTISDGVQVLSGIWKGLKGIGSPSSVTITWYTGHDLLNPSCWAKTDWAPTDQSFVCAVTMEGWTDKPQCFKFIEICNKPQKCIFVRVVDTCAGCRTGSQHLDLTRRGFAELADLDTGILTVSWREASGPDDWSEDLWGPKS
ncbi:unnamed protein product [Mycena citricolor]|uniref:RlpA-like protein double-psi beta-barrel domain-containing protein n=1 Tax=Mycena citricolor TaxID=2018698 RepID=A0AAD2K2Q0_9AGAR|nr:unnamed protein product [Mycena citricolor]